MQSNEIILSISNNIQTELRLKKIIGKWVEGRKQKKPQANTIQYLYTYCITSWNSN